MSKRVSKKAELPLPIAEPESEQKVARKPRGSKNDVVKSRLSVVLDLLNFDDQDDSGTVKKNVLIAVKHLKDINTLLWICWPVDLFFFDLVDWPGDQKNKTKSIAQIPVAVLMNLTFADTRLSSMNRRIVSYLLAAARGKY